MVAEILGDGAGQRCPTPMYATEEFKEHLFLVPRLTSPNIYPPPWNNAQLLCPFMVDEVKICQRQMKVALVAGPNGLYVSKVKSMDPCALTNLCNCMLLAGKALNILKRGRSVLIPKGR